MTDMDMLRRLELPKGVIDVALDTDAYNEIDDQFAIAYALRSPERINLTALYAAPFHNSRSESAEDGMVKSCAEIKKLLRLAERGEMIENVFEGSRGYLKDEKTPVDSPAARDLVRRAMNYSADKPLYVVAIGAITNVASAILMRPEIAERIAIVWLGGHALHWPDTREFNMYQDVAAARVVFGCACPVVQLPCMGVVDHCTTTKPELEHWLKGKNPLADYLAENTISEAESYASGRAWSRVIWDAATIAYLMDETGEHVLSRAERAPMPEFDDHYSFDPRRHFFKYVWHIDRDWLFTDMFSRLVK